MSALSSLEIPFAENQDGCDQRDYGVDHRVDHKGVCWLAGHRRRDRSANTAENRPVFNRWRRRAYGANHGVFRRRSPVGADRGGDRRDTETGASHFGPRFDAAGNRISAGFVQHVDVALNS